MNMEHPPPTTRVKRSSNGRNIPSRRIQNFVFVLNNGIRKGMHEFLPSDRYFSK